MSSDSEYEEEEFYVFSDFKKQLIPQDISFHAIKIIGIETKNPVAELNGNIFQGSYDNAMATNVCFEKDNTERTVNPIFEDSCRQKYKVLATTNKIINFQRIYIEKKQTDSSEETKDNGTAKQKPNHKINVTYEDLIRRFPVCGEEN